MKGLKDKMRVIETFTIRLQCPLHDVILYILVVHPSSCNEKISVIVCTQSQRDGMRLSLRICVKNKISCLFTYSIKMIVTLLS